MAKVRSVNHGRIKERYSPKMTAREKRHKEFVKSQGCWGCGNRQADAHHWMGDAPGKRWRRDHQWQIGVCHYGCHQGPNGIHGLGSERLWLESIGQTEEAAVAYMQWMWEQSA